MERRKLAGCGLIAGLGLLIASCGGGGGGGASSGSHPIGGGPTFTPVPGAATVTPTPLRASSSRNERTETNDAGSITLRLQDIDFVSGQSTLFSVFLLDANGNPVANKQLTFDTGLQVSLPNGDSTRADGSLTGSVSSSGFGRFALTVSVADQSFAGLSVTLTIFVDVPIGGTPTPTGPTRTPLAVTPTPLATQTPTPLPCVDVETIIVQTDTPNVSSQSGGTPKITAVVFDSNNLPVGNVNVLFDVQPRIGTFNPLVAPTDSSGNTKGAAQSELRIPASSSFGVLTVTASACGKAGNVDINIVSGVSTKPVTTVVLQADPATVSSITGGNVNLTAAVLDGDNQAINGIDVLFITPVGRVSPLIDRTKVSGAQGGIAHSTVQIPVGAIQQPYVISALAGGITGSTSITVIPDRVGPGGVNPDVPSGEPASITLGASPTRIQVAGTGGTELATLIGRVFDNNGNALPGVRVHYHVLAAQSSPGAVILPVTQPTPSGSPTPVPSTLCAPDDSVAVSDNAGFAVIQLRAGTGPGPVTVVACADTIVKGVPSPLIEQQAVVTVTSGPVNHLGLTINSRFIDNNDGTLLTTVSAIVTDAQGNTVEDGTPVFFEVLTRRVCSGGSNDGQSCASDTDCSGGACVCDPTDPACNVAISSNATTNAPAPCDTSQFVVQTGLPISAQPGDAISCIKYPNIQAGSEVSVRTSVAGVVNNIHGQTLTLPGRVGDLQASVSPSTVTLTSTSDGLAVVRASVLNLYGDPVENVRVRFTTSIGTIDRSVLTDANGEADATLTIPAGTPSGTAALRVLGGGLQIPNIPVPFVNQGGSTTPTPGSADQAGAIQFVSAVPDTIGVRGSGLPPKSKLTFQVVNETGTPIAGVPVNFSLAKIADESITPTQGVTDANGNAQVTLTSGNRALSVQVTAQIFTATGPFTVRSTPVNILGGPPSQPNFSLAHQFHNISGQVTFGLTDIITAFVGDRFGNPVPPGTAVSFTTKGGVIGNLTGTNSLGQATGTLVSQAPVPADGIVATLATTQGERPFIDRNGNGVCDSQDELLPVPEPFYDANCNSVHDDGEDFIDLNDDGQFNSDQGSGTPVCDDHIVVFESICTTFSAQTGVVLLSSGTGPLEAGGSRDYTLIVSDNPDPIGNPGVGNPIVGGSTVAVTINGSRARVLGLTNFTMPDTQTIDRIVDGINRFAFSVVDNAPASNTSETDTVIVTVTSAGLPAGGNGSVTVQDFLTFLPVPTATPTVPPPSATPTVTPTPSITPTPTPVAAHIQVALFVNQASNNGDGTLTSVISALVTDAQNAVVGNGVPVQFSIIPLSPTPNVPSGVAVTSPGLTGLAAPCTLGFSVVPQPGDALSCIKYDQALQGQRVRIQAQVQGVPPATQDIVLPDFRTPVNTPTNTPTATSTPTVTPTATPAAAHIQVALFVNQASNNGDGTLTSVISALVTDAQNAAVGNGVPVQFSIIPLSPTPSVPNGVAVTSPGLTGLAAPCTLGFPVVPQPGDALSCIKYDIALQGQRVRIQAQVQGVPAATQDITLPDLRTPVPTNTWTSTPTPTFTLTATASITPTPTPPAAHIQVALFVNQASNNGDGTLTSVISALVTDAQSAAVGNGVPVQFSIIPLSPTPSVPNGVAVTSPGLTGLAAPCTLGFPVVPQPGDALSCIKYDIALQGQRVRIQAQVQGVAPATQDITLPDLRTAVPTFTPTSTPTSTYTQTPTSTPTWTFTPTATTVPPTIAPIHTTLFAGVGSAPSSCDGTRQTFVVTGGSPPFTIAGPSGCLSTTLVTVSGGSFTFTAGSAVGDSVVTATDALGRTTTAGVHADGADAAFIKLDLLVNQRSDNGDGSFSSVLSALLTDSNGVVVEDGVPVQFSLVNPVSGVSVTSPGFTHQAQPCTVSFSVVPQPGDALSCIKYVQSLQGTTITVRARVRIADGSVIEDTETITLPDTRPTATPTTTSTPTSTGTPTITSTPTPFPTGQPTFTPPDTATPTATIPVGSLVFVSAQPATIGVRASGLPEQAVLTFQARNTQATPIAGATVQFQLTGSGSELLDPTTAVTDVNGFVTTTVTSGTRATTVRVTASADSNGDSIPDIFVQSQVVSIVGAPPAFNHFSIGPAKHNVAGRITLGLTDTVSVFVNDRFGNAVPPGTAVSFITNAASIVNPTTTDSSGIATATLLTEGIVPPSGIVTVLAFTRGEESFLDNNGNGKFDCVGVTQPPCTGSGVDDILTDDVPEPFIDYRPRPAPAVPNDSACTVAAPSPVCNDMFDPSKPFELFVDSGAFDGLWDAQGTTGVWDNNIFVWATTPVTFSGPLVTPVASPNSFTINNGGSQFFTLEVHDDLVNPLVGGSTISISASSGTITGGSITIPDGESYNQLVDGLTRFGFVLSDDDSMTTSARAASITVTITSANGTGTFVIASGTLDAP